jgi:hypothetical protein
VVVAEEVKNSVALKKLVVGVEPENIPAAAP